MCFQYGFIGPTGIQSEAEKSVSWLWNGKNVNAIMCCHFINPCYKNQNSKNSNSLYTTQVPGALGYNVKYKLNRALFAAFYIYWKQYKNNTFNFWPHRNRNSCSGRSTDRHVHQWELIDGYERLSYWTDWASLGFSALQSLVLYMHKRYGTHLHIS